MQHVAHPLWPVVAVHRGGQLAPQPLALRSLPFFQPIADVARLDHPLLHPVIRIPLETPSLLAGIRRQAFWGDHFIDRVQLRRLRTLRASLTLFAFLSSPCLRFLVHSARLDRRLAFVSLQASDLFLQFVYLLLLVQDDSQQLLHPGRQLRLGYLGQFRLWARHGLKYMSAPVRYDSFLPGFNEKLQVGAYAQCRRGVTRRARLRLPGLSKSWTRRAPSRHDGREGYW